MVLHFSNEAMGDLNYLHISLNSEYITRLRGAGDPPLICCMNNDQRPLGLDSPRIYIHGRQWGAYPWAI